MKTKLFVLKNCCEFLHCIQRKLKLPDLFGNTSIHDKKMTSCKRVGIKFSSRSKTKRKHGHRQMKHKEILTVPFARVRKIR